MPEHDAAGEDAVLESQDVAPISRGVDDDVNESAGAKAAVPLPTPGTEVGKPQSTSGPDIKEPVNQPGTELGEPVITSSTEVGESGEPVVETEQSTRTGEPVTLSVTTIPASQYSALPTTQASPVASKPKRVSRFSSLFRSRSRKEVAPAYTETEPALPAPVADEVVTPAVADGGGNAVIEEDETHLVGNGVNEESSSVVYVEEEVPIKEVVPDNRTVLEIAIDTPLPQPAYTAKTMARHEKERKQREYEEMVERERIRRDRELLYKRERIMNAYTGRQGKPSHEDFLNKMLTI